MSAENEKLTYVIDTEMCAGHGRCYGLAPESFESDDFGYGRVIGVPQDAGNRAAMEEIAAQCPESAISIQIAVTKA
jgi:ferredoxin